MNEKSILSLLVGPGIFSGKELKEVASKAFNPKFLKEFDELGIKLPDDTRDSERYSDDGAEASPISMTHEEEEKIENRLSQKYTRLSQPQGTAKNIFKPNRLEEVAWDDFNDEGQEDRPISGPTPLIIPKPKEIKPNPWEKMPCDQILVTIGSERGREIYKLTDLYLPTTPELRRNVFKYLYRNLIRNPKDILRLHKARQEGAQGFDKEILRIFKLMYNQKFSMKQEVVLTKQPEASVSIMKDNIKNPTTYSNDPIFSPLNSTEWFNSLHHDLMKGIQRENDMEVEKDHQQEEKQEAEPALGWVHQNGTLIGAGGANGRLTTTIESSLRRGGNTNQINTGAYAGLFDYTPTRENGEASVRSENRSVGHPFGGGTPRNESETNGLGTYNRSLNQNMRQYLNDNYEGDRKALFSFYTGLKGHDKNETALWGETQKEVLNFYGFNGTGPIKENINYNYLVLPFKNDKERSIFKYQTDMQDASEMEMILLHKKRRLGKDEEVKTKVGLSDNMYFNNNVLEATWNDFFFKVRPQPQKEKEYSLVLIDLNDKSIFYDKVHPFIFGVQKATKKAIPVFEDLPDQPNALEDQQIEDNKDMQRMDSSDINLGGLGLQPKPSQISLGDRKLHAPSESDSISKRDITNPHKIKNKERLKALRIQAVIKGYDPHKLTMENAWTLLDRPERSESRPENVSLPPVLKLVNDLKRKIPTSTSIVIQHSKVAEEFQFNEFHIKRQDYEYFHRPDLRKLIEKDKPIPWRIEIVKQEEEKKEQDQIHDDPFGVNELVDSFEYFKNHKRLSLREGKFALFEYIEENPLIMSNVGMASRINRYVYPKRAVKLCQTQKGGINESEELNEFVRMIKEKLGANGSITFLDEKQNLPLIGQLTNEKFIGVTIMENNMFYAPIFIHKAPETDFVLVRYQSSDGSKRYYLRKIDYMYTVGQIEPKIEVFNPSSRSLTSFIRKSIKHTIKKKFANGESVHMEEMKQLFPTMNDHNMKKFIQYYGGDPDPEDNKRFFYNKDVDHEQIEDDPERNEGNITPEEVCQYERMHASNVRLKNIGFEDLRSCDKINTIRNRYIKRNKQKILDETVEPNEKRGYAKMNIVANYCAEELQLTAWNLSQSFLSSKQKQGRLYLTGFGDPTGGHGGYSYVKLPLKTSRYEKEEKKTNSQKLNQVTGTNADLRKLPIKHVERMIKTYGKFQEEHIQRLTRWDKIDLLRQIANEHPENEELAKYARAFRLTTKMQREKYQKDINNLFMKFVDNMAKQGDEDIVSDDDGEFECSVEDLIDKEVEEVLKKTPKDLNQAEELSAMDDENENENDNDNDKGDEDDDEIVDDG